MKMHTAIQACLLGACASLLLSVAPANARDDISADLATDLARYLEAWASRDVERIVALHTDDSEFVLQMRGAEAAVGQPAIRAQFTRILEEHPTYSATIRSMSYGSDFVVVEYDISMQPPEPFILGVHRFVPATAAYALPAIDVLHFRNGRVSRKLTFIDSESVHYYSEAVQAWGAGQ